MLMPSPISVVIADMPSGVPGTLISTFSRPICACARRAYSTVPLASFASVGATSKLT